MQTDRRHVLHLGALGAASLAGPGWLTAAFAQDDDGVAQEPNRPVRTAWEKAKRAGRPLLVIVVPAGGWQRRRPRGRMWGELLNLGTDELLADLGLCDVICASATALRKELPEGYDFPKGEPLAILVETHDYSARPFDPELDDVPQPGPMGGGPGYEERVMKRVFALEKEIRKLVAPDIPTLEVRSARVCESYDARAAKKRGGEPDDLRERRALVLDRLAAENTEGAERKARIAAIGERVARRLRKLPPTGANWVLQTPCGIAVEGADGAPGGPCGTAFCPEVSRRFLRFITESQ